MASQRIKFTVGLFVASGITIALLAIIWLGMSRFLEKGQYYVTYFNESVQGLDIDSPVKYRGVTIGRVEKIGVAPDAKLVRVVLKIESGQVLDSGMVAQLKAVGITGSMFIELDQRREGEPDRSPSPSFPSEYPIVASRPSEISELLRGIDHVLRQIKALDLEGISGKIKLALDSVNQKVSEADVSGISNKIESSFENLGDMLDNQKWDSILASIETASQSLGSLMYKADRGFGRLENALIRVEGIVVDKEEAIKRAIEDFREAGKNANIFLEKGTSLVGSTEDSISHLKRHLLVVAQNLERASENLNQLSELLADQPSLLLFGEPSTRRKVEPKSYQK
jgi:phospholipid/cholesterol/gamma-HCH transport system substrate-binding protein